MKALLNSPKLDKEAVDFTLVKTEEFLPCLNEALKEARENIKSYKQQAGRGFKDIILDFEATSKKADIVIDTFYFYHGTMSDDKFQEISPEFTQKVTEFSNELGLDLEIFEKIKDLYERKDSQELGLTDEQRAVVESYYKDFTRNGALLSDSEKEKLKKINEEQSQVSLSFSQNALKYNNEYFLHITDEKKLEGLPDSAKEAAKEEAKSRDLEGWGITLDYPSYIPVLTYATSRELRKELYLAKATCANEGELSNKGNIKKALELKEARAILLGYNNHAEFVLEKRMAKNPQTVFKFLEELKEPSLNKAKAEAKELLELFHVDYPGQTIEPWDRSFYAEKLKVKKLNFDEEQLRPYFSLDRVVKGAFETASKLYDIKFIERADLPKYQEDVRIYEVRNQSDDKYVGLFYSDFFPRKTKRAGAWMTNIKSQGMRDSEVKRPHVAIVCNFTKPTSTKPSLLSLNEVLTLFHEFGHALHGLLADVMYTKLSGTSVFWDFVELPSQMMENWVYEKECLDLFATHYETNEPMSQDLIDKVAATKKFLSGITSARQLSFATMDMKYHTTKAQDIDVDSFETNIFKEFDVFNSKSYGLMSCSFGHIFAGGYAAGYYSYKWAEVLDADAFEAFKEKGIFSQEVARSFKENILAKGGTEHPMDLYKKFRGGEPSVEALLTRSGLK